MYYFIVKDSPDHPFYSQQISNVFDIDDIKNNFDHRITIHSYNKHYSQISLQPITDLLDGYLISVDNYSDAVLFKLKCDSFIKMPYYFLAGTYQNIKTTELNTFFKKISIQNDLIEKYNGINQSLDLICVDDINFQIEDDETYQRILKLQEILCEINTTQKIAIAKNKIEQATNDLKKYFDERKF